MRPAPLGSAGALAYALLGQLAGRPTHHGVLQIVAVVVAAALAGAVPHVARGRGPAVDHVARRVLTVAFAAVCFQPLYNSGRLEERVGQGPYLVLFLLLLLGLTALCDAVLAAALAAARTGWPYGPLLRDELRAQLGIGSAICATGVVMALGVAGAGLWALPVFSVPLLLTQMSFHRITAIRTTYRQTITSLARATEIAKLHPARPLPPGRLPELRRRPGAGAVGAGAHSAGVRRADARHRAALPRRPGPGRGDRAAARRRSPADRRAGRGGGPPDRGAGRGRRGGGAAGGSLPGAARRRPHRAGGERVRRPGRMGTVTRAAHWPLWSSSAWAPGTSTSRRSWRAWRGFWPGVDVTELFLSNLGNPWVMSGRPSGHGWMPVRGTVRVSARLHCRTGRRES